MKYLVSFVGACGLGSEVLGNKGSRLVEMTSLDLPVPLGCVIPTDIHEEYLKTGVLPLGLVEELQTVFEVLGRSVSVRSSPELSMPGMMETVLDLTSIEDVLEAVEDVLKSWQNDKATQYRQIFKLSEKHRTAVVIQRMVHGNVNRKSGTGILLTADPLGVKVGARGEYLPECRGDQLVQGLTTPKDLDFLTGELPGCYSQLIEYGEFLEKFYSCPQEIEFTIENGVLYLLQTRNLTIYNNELNIFPLPSSVVVKAEGKRAAGGVVEGKAAFSYEEVGLFNRLGYKTVFITQETRPEHLPIMNLADGIVTLSGGMTSHAAVVCRALGKPCVVGCGSVDVESGETIVLDGDRGIVYSPIVEE